MKHIFSIIIIGFFTIASVFAEDTVKFYSDKKEYDIEDIIQLQAILEYDVPPSDDEGGPSLNDIQNVFNDSSFSKSEYIIEGVQSFQKISTNKQIKGSILNGKKRLTVIWNISFLSPQKGTYTLLSKATGDGETFVKSEPITIDITGDRIMVNNKFDNIQKNLGIKKDLDTIKESETDIDDIILDSSTIDTGEEIEIIPKKIFGVDGIEMSDIYRDKGFLRSYALLKKILVIIAIIVAMIVGLILGKKYLQKYLDSRKKILDEEIIEIIEEKIEIDYQDLLNTIKSKYKDSSKEIFYAKTGDLYRIYLDDKVQKGLSKGSLQEVQKYFKRSNIDSDLKNKFLNFYTKIYFPEYDNLEDNLEKRNAILEDLEKIIIVKEFK